MNQSKLKGMMITLMVGVLLIPFAQADEGKDSPALTPETDEEGADSIAEKAREIVREAAEEVQEVIRGIQWTRDGEKKEVTYLGVAVEPVPEVLRDYIELPKGTGLLITNVVKGGPAHLAGLQNKDILVEFEDQLIVNFSQLSALLNMREAGDSVTVEIIRKGQTKQFDVSLEKRVRQNGEFIEVPGPGNSQQEPEETDQRLTSLEDKDVSRVVQKIEEWLPGSVRLYIDEKEQVYVDLHELKKDLADLKEQLQSMDFQDPSEWQYILNEYGNLGLRKALIHMGDHTIYISDDGKRVRLDKSAEKQEITIWDADGELLYKGQLAADYKETIPPEAADLIEQFHESQKNLDAENSNESNGPATLNKM